MTRMLSVKTAKAIIQKSDFADGESLELAAPGAKSLRQNYIKNHKDKDETKVAAAIEIQRTFRGYCTRCRVTNILHHNASKTAVYGESKIHLNRLKDVRTPSAPRRKKLNARQRLEQYYQGYVNNRIYQDGLPADSPDIMTFEHFIAIYIQTWWYQQKSKLKLEKRENGVKTKKKRTPSSVEEAARIIQRAWRRHIDIQVFRYYRDLINFRQRGDPSLMLRCINPNEAKMLDAAMGVHIKFRLAGDRFPPNIYYKIYTHRPVQDLCANSPKDYTRATAKMAMARDVHNKGNRVPQPDTSGWYKRMENNGWRLVSDRLIHHAISDPVTWDTSKKPVSFHHNKFQRREDVERKKKRKKIEWMQKMYKSGMLKAKVEDKETVALIEGAAAGMVATVDLHGPDVIADWEVDELLDWTTSLNFEDYWGGWKEMATSGCSETQAEERSKLRGSSSDPFEIMLRNNNNHGRYASSSRPSHNTPVSSQSAGSILIHD